MSLISQFLMFLREEEQSADQQYWFEPNREFIRITDRWSERYAKLRTRIAQECDKEVTLFDSISMGAKSQQGLAVCIPQFLSLPQHIREAVNKAAIETKVAALKEKQALDLKEAKLKAEIEELLLRTA